MPIAMLVENPRVTREIYDEIRTRIGRDVPAGGYVHVAGEGPNGWRVIEVWESEDDARRFLQEELAPALADIGVEGPPPTPQFWPVHSFIADRQAAGVR